MPNLVMDLHLSVGAETSADMKTAEGGAAVLRRCSLHHLQKVLSWLHTNNGLNS